MEQVEAAMSTDNYMLMINRPLPDVLDYFTDLEAAPLPLEGALSFEGVQGGTRITLTTPEGVASFFKLADLLIAQAARRHQGGHAPQLVFEP
mgnify:CR=1 FL=1